MKLDEFPKEIHCGEYIATLRGILDPGPLQSVVWDIKREEIATMFEGPAYGWGKPTISIRPLVWSGKWPPGASDPRSPYYGWLFDIGPSNSYQEAMQKLAHHADRLIAWRKEQHP